MHTLKETLNINLKAIQLEMANTLQSKIDKAAVNFKMRDESVVPVDKISVDDLDHVTSIANGQGEQ